MPEANEDWLVALEGEVMGSITQWFDGYTDPDSMPDGRQRRVTYDSTRDDDNTMLFCIEDPHGDDPERYLEVKVQLREVIDV